MNGVLTAVLVVVVSAGTALICAEAVHLSVARLGRRSPVLADLARKARRSFRATLVVYAIQQGLRSGIGSFPGRATVLHGLLVLIIAASAWLVAELLLVIEDAALQRWRTDVPDNLRARRVRTQIVILRRVTVAAVVVVAFGAALMTFRPVRLIGTSVLASAGLVSVVAALAAQSTLGNVFAGLQLAFSDAVRIDDVVVVEQEWGKVEELTLTYVALHVWDDRRLILPTSYFTTKPFQNWTRSGSAVLGTAEIDVDFSAGVEELRAELRRICEASELWDERVCVLQVTDATGGNVRLRALVSAADAAALWDLRCLVRERLVTYLYENAPGTVPRVRAELDGQGDPKPHVPHPPGRPADSRVFSGGADGRQRGAAFGPESPDPTR